MAPCGRPQRSQEPPARSNRTWRLSSGQCGGYSGRSSARIGIERLKHRRVVADKPDECAVEDLDQPESNYGLGRSIPEIRFTSTRTIAFAITALRSGGIRSASACGMPFFTRMATVSTSVSCALVRPPYPCPVKGDLPRGPFRIQVVRWRWPCRSDCFARFRRKRHRASQLKDERPRPTSGTTSQ